MPLMQATTPISHVGLRPGKTQGSGSAARLRLPLGARRTAGLLGLLGVLATVALLSADAAAQPTQFVPAREGGWPVWLAGPLRQLGSGLGSSGFQTLMLIMCASYALILLSGRALAAGPLVAAILLAHLILLLGPPLISQDVFGYLAFARMGALHGLDPYTHFAAEAPSDPVFQYVGWPFQHSPYGPLFTLASYATAPFSIATGLWAFKALAAASSLAAVALIARAASRLGHDGRWAAAFVGLNPVLLVMAVGGAHNDTLVMLMTALALLATAPSLPSMRGGVAALAGGVGVKLTAGLLLPFLVLSAPSTRERLRTASSAVLALLALVALGVVGFGIHALGFLDAVGEQQQLVATHSIPAETARLVGLSGTPGWWRHLFVACFLLSLAWALWRTVKGADWRVAAGWATLALLLSTAWLLPWYGIWLLPLAAVSGDRRLRAATLAFCAYAVLIHLPLADPLLSPSTRRVAENLHLRVPGIRNRVELTGLQILGNVQVYLRW